MSGQFGLLKTRRFAPFFATQFLGAFNDNLFKNALVVLLTFQAAQWTTLKPELLANLAAGIFILPFFLFSATAGQLADKYDKAMLARLVKVLEMVIMGVAAAGFFLHSLPVLMAALFMLGCHSTLFGPVKYAIIPQHLHEEELVGGNALIEAGTFVAILIGTLAGGLLAGSVEHPAWIAVGGFVVAFAGYLTSRGIPAAPAPAPALKVNLNPLSETWRNIAFARQNRTVFLSILGISWFWLYGALFLAQFPAYAKFVLGGGESSVTLLLAVFTVGIGIGSMLCERMSGKHVEIGLVPFGSIGLTLFGLDLYFASPVGLAGTTPHELLALLSIPAIWRVLFDLMMLGVFGGFFIVPLYALVQLRSSPECRARIIAANNILNALFMVVGALGAAAALGEGLSMPALFGIAALLNAAVAIYIYGLVPEFLLRFVAWLLVKAIYRLRTTGLENIPQEGAAVLVANHVSFADAVIIMGASPRPIRFVMDHRIFKTPLLGFVFRHCGAIPIASAKEDPAMMEAAFAEVARALANGDLVGIFPEGHITRDGEVQPFRPGISRILAANPVSVVPMALSGLWGSFFSRVDGHAMQTPFRRGLFSDIALSVGAAVAPAEATPECLQARVRDLRGNIR
ncbi:MFS transporter [Ferribacterium limneticum]|uniref:MFS transporter n=1 Tax=Ferribacterium limneticum TaxID=76259 RepID=UPI001CF9F675|nr:MFS transporter [Ferribacterium limneticum]UCV28925.1 MFS transporter [Ferribacterium limneticum]UCV32843.1 MFS transporter [Ferribacterium limneticum]